MTEQGHTLTIRDDDLSGPEITQLLRGHRSAAVANSPPGAAHALDLAALKRPEVTVWSAWYGDQLAGCGGLREISKTHAEVKAMHTAASHVRKGVATTLLHHMMSIARERGYKRLSLETGKSEEFRPAREFYKRFDFLPCPPFGDYVDDGFSVCMTRVV